VLPLMGRPPYDTRGVRSRRVSSAGRVADAGHHYAVPYLCGGCYGQLRVEAELARLEIWAAETCLALPPLLPGHGRPSLQPDHLAGLWSLTRQGKGPRPRPTPSPPPRGEEATAPLHLPELSAMPAVEVRPLTVYAAFAEAGSA